MCKLSRSKKRNAVSHNVEIWQSSCIYCGKSIDGFDVGPRHVYVVSAAFPHPSGEEPRCDGGQAISCYCDSASETRLTLTT